MRAAPQVVWEYEHEGGENNSNQDPNKEGADDGSYAEAPHRTEYWKADKR